jgi:hypothetical protein
MVAVVQDLKWPFAADKVTLVATSMTGNRARFYLASKPRESGLALWDFEQQNWFDGTDKNAWFSPDVDGSYGITCVDTTVSVNAPHYDGDGATGSGVGVGLITTNGTTTHTVYVGATLQRSIGISPHTATLSLKGHTTSTASYGVMTYYAGSGYAPVLTGAVTDVAKQALRATSVVSAMAAIGASGYSGSLSLLTWQSVVTYEQEGPRAAGYYNLADAVSRMQDRVVSHVLAQTMTVHGGSAGTAVATAALGSLASCITRMNSFRTVFNTHRVATAAAAHWYPDTFDIIVSGCTGVATATLASRYAASYALAFKDHAEAGPLVTPAWYASTYRVVHLYRGDLTNTISAITTPVSIASCCTVIRTLCQKYCAHIITTSVTATYHVHSMYAWSALVGATPTTLADIAAKVNTTLDVLHHHASNKAYPGGTAATYHTIKDFAAYTDTVPRASPDDLGTTIRAFEMCEYLFTKHVARGSTSGVHTLSTTTGWWVKTPTGVELVHHKFLDSIDDMDAISPANENVPTTKLIKIGGFEKA